MRFANFRKSKADDKRDTGYLALSSVTGDKRDRQAFSLHIFEYRRRVHEVCVLIY